MSVHSHIKSLGLDAQGKAITPSPSGYFGNAEAREAAGKLASKVKSQKVKGSCVFISGPGGSGKSGLIHAIQQEIGSKVPMCYISGSEFGNKEELLKSNRVSRMRMALRRAFGVRMQQTKSFLEGEVSELTLHEAPNKENVERIGKNVSHITLILKSAKGTRTFHFDPNIYNSLYREEVQVGDIVHVEISSGLVKRLGRCDAYKYEYDIENEIYLPLPKGEVEQTRQVTQKVSLHEIDFATANPEAGSDLLSQVKSMVQNTGLAAINMSIRAQVDSFVSSLVEQGKAEVTPGLLIIENAHLMSFELYSFLSCLVSQEDYVPFILLAGDSDSIDKRNENAAQVYKEFFMHCECINLAPLSHEELSAAVTWKTQHEQVGLDDDSFKELSRAAAMHGLKYVFALLPIIHSVSKGALANVEVTRRVLETCRPRAANGQSI